MATARTTIGRLHVATVLQTFINTEVLPGTGVKPAKFWKGFNAIVADLAGLYGGTLSLNRGRRLGGMLAALELPGRV